MRDPSQGDGPAHGSAGRRGAPGDLASASNARRDPDLAARGVQLHAAAWSLLAGCAGILIGFLIAYQTGWSVVWTIVGGFLTGSAPTYVAVMILSEASSLAVVSVVAPSGSSTPSRPDYSLAKTYVVQGRFPQAVEQYRKHIDESPFDPEPRLQLARLYRDDLMDLEESVKWFRQAVAVAADPRLQYLGVRELADVFVSRIKEPRRALPDLARFADEHPGTASGDWARHELEQIKRDAAWEG